MWCLVQCDLSLQGEISTQTRTEGGPGEDVSRRRHLQAKGRQPSEEPTLLRPPSWTSSLWCWGDIKCDGSSLSGVCHGSPSKLTEQCLPFFDFSDLPGVTKSTSLNQERLSAPPSPQGSCPVGGGR